MSNAAHWPNRGLARRDFLVASATGLAGLTASAAGLAGGSAFAASPSARAKSTILFFLCGGISHIDTWDLKPRAPREYRGEFEPIATSAPGVVLCEHLPMLARQAHHLTLVNSINGTVNTNDHHAGYYHNLTGHVPDPSFLSLGNNRTPFPDDWPYMGSVVAAKRPQQAGVPSAITLPWKPSRAPYTRPGQFAGKLGIQFDPLYVYGNREKTTEFKVPDLVLSSDVPSTRLFSRQELLTKFDTARRDLDRLASVQTWNAQQARAMSLLASSKTMGAFDVAKESPETLARYGDSINSMSLLAARRLVEIGVPFITVFWSEEDEVVSKKCLSGGGWDTHGSNFACLKENLLPEFDRGFSALIEDLSQRNLLDSTLVLVTSEMGRTPKIGDVRTGGTSGAGRDHWTHCLTDVLAGGGLRGGQTYGASDRLAEYPADKPVTPAHIARTVYHAMGIDDLDFIDREGRPHHLLADGKPLVELF